MNKEQREKTFAYAAAITAALSAINDEDSDAYIPKEELTQGDNLSHFFHALANMVPTYIYNELSGIEMNTLEFNYIANRLCFQYGIRPDEKDEEGE